MDAKEVIKKCRNICNSDSEVILVRNSVQISELCSMRDRFKADFLTKEEISDLIDYICTS